jgi:plastocyanin
MMIRLQPITARLFPGRAVVFAMLLGPLFGAMLALKTVAAEEANEIKIDNFAFNPPELTVAVGTTVMWVNHDDITHSVVDKNKAFRSKALSTNNSFSFTFATAGTYDYSCGVHPQMMGKIVVK